MVEALRTRNCLLFCGEPDRLENGVIVNRFADKKSDRNQTGIASDFYNQESRIRSAPTISMSFETGKSLSPK